MNTPYSSLQTLDAILDRSYTSFMCAMGAAVEYPIRFDPMADDLAPAMGAGGRQRVNSTFEAIEHVRSARHHDLECLVIVIPTDLATCHLESPFVFTAS
jgi:hypothetical protein